MIEIYISNQLMSFQNQNIGMMDEGYFVSRGDILKWLNDLLQLNLTKIQQLGAGSVYCQVIDVVHPGKVAMNKVNWKAKNDYEFIQNLRLLQDAFNKIGIKRYIEVQKLAKAKYQDNLEFAQWLKRYYDLNCGDRGSNYLAQERRTSNPDFGFAEKNVVPKTYNGSGMIVPKKDPVKQPVKETVKQVADPAPKKTSTATRPPNRQPERPKKIQKKPQVNNSSPTRQDKKERLKEEASNEKERGLNKKMKDLEDKLLMITEILQSEESSDLKIQMIAEVVELQQKQQHQEQAEQYFQPVKQEAVKYVEQHTEQHEEAM